MNNVTHPHDRFFKAVFSQKEVVVDFLQNYLPADIAHKFDYESLKIVKNSFVDPKLLEYFSDLLFELKWSNGKWGYIYLLFEHKSFMPPLISFQLLRYMIQIWELALSQQKRLYPVLPVVLYHGEAKWCVGLNFKDIFETPPELEPYLPDYRYWLCDLSPYSDAEIKGQVLLQVHLLLMKYIFSEDLPKWLPEIFTLLREIRHGKTGLDYLETIFRYIASAGKHVTDENLKSAIKAAIPQGGAVMSSLAQKWFEEGEQKGIKEGLEQGLQQGIQQGLQQGLKQGLKQGLQQGLQQGIQQGIQQGLLDYIELSLEFRFGSEGLRELTRIRKITDVDVLYTIRKGIKTIKSLKELRKLYQ